jgi:hypothetical protein
MDLGSSVFTILASWGGWILICQVPTMIPKSTSILWVFFRIYFDVEEGTYIVQYKLCFLF